MSRRTTLGTLSSGVANSRASLGPARVVGKNSMGAGGGRMSMAPPTTKRNSSIGPSRMSMAPSTARYSSVALKNDPRPISDKSYFVSSSRKLIQYLTENGYDHAISQKTIQSPTSKEFLTILTFLMRKIDMNFKFGQKFEEEVPALFKRLRYPFQISKRTLQSVGSPHTWPYLLAALNWLVELVQQGDEAQQTESAELMDGDNGEKLFFEYLAKSYQSFLSGEDNFSALEEELQMSFETKTAGIKEEIDSLTEKNSEMKKRLEILENEPSPLSVLQRKKSDLLSDTEKFQKLISNLEEYKEQLVKKEEERKADFEGKELELITLRNERADLEEQLKEQELTPADVERIKHEKHKLEECLNEMTEKRSQLEKEKWELEMQLGSTLDELNRRINNTINRQLDSIAFQHNRLATNLKIVPSTAKNANGKNYEISVNREGTRPEDIVPLDTKELKPIMRQLKQKYTEKMLAKQKVLIDSEERLQRQKDIYGEKEDEIGLFEKKLTKSENQYKKEKEELGAKYSATSDEVEQLEAEIRKMKGNMAQAVSDAKETLNSVKKEYEELDEKFAREKEDASNIVIELLETITAHKQHILDSLGELEASVAVAKSEHCQHAEE